MAGSKVNIDIFMWSTSSDNFKQCEPSGVKKLSHIEKLKCDIIMPSLFVKSRLENKEIEAEYKKFTIEKVLIQLKDGVDKDAYKKDLENILCVSIVNKVRECADRVIKLKD